MNKICVAAAVMLLALFSCTNNDKLTAKYKAAGVGERGILLSCLSCGCVPGFLNSPEYLAKHKYDLKVFADTTCYGPENKFIITPFPRANFDSIQDDNYNAIMFKTENGVIRTKLMKTDDARRFEKVVDDFFK